ncbi:hypothetical protein ACHAXT_012909 [Thalassiosira profunda]
MAALPSNFLRLSIKPSCNARRASLSQQRCLSTKREGYQSIGSFHSDNVEELIRLPNDQYTPPALPFDVSGEGVHMPPHPSDSALPFANSHRFVRAYSRLDRESWTFLNHGAFGLALDVGLQRANSWRDCLESQPLRYFDRHLLNHLVHSARGIVDFVTKTKQDAGRMREGVALLPNVTSGMNAVVGGHARCRGKNALAFYYDTAYGSNKKMCQAYHGKQNAIAIPFEEDYLPLLQKVSSDRERNNANSEAAEVFITALDATIRKHMAQSNCSKSSISGALLILDHITSNTAIHMPISAIAKFAKEEYGMLVAVDGAHALLSLPLDMGSLLSTGNAQDDGTGNVDVYLTNAHKWFSSPRGAAALFCANPELRDTILRQPAVVSHGVDDGFFSRFLWDGCRDYTAQLSLPAILGFWNAANADTVREDMQRNMKEGVRILLTHWYGEHSAEAGLTLVPLGLHAPTMALVRLPSGGEANADRKSSADAKRVQDLLYENNVEVPIKCIRGVLYARVSCHVYNSAAEFERLALAE